MTVFWIVMIAVLVLSVPVTLLWWGIGDRWADSEHKRFGRDVPEAAQKDTGDSAVVIPDPASPRNNSQS